MTGGAALGVVSSVYAIKSGLTEKTNPFIENLKSRYNKDPNWVSYASYDAVYLMKAAADRARSTDIEALINSLEALEMVSVSGKAKFDKTHTYIYGYPYVTSARTQFQKDGLNVIVFPYDVAKITNPGKTFIPVNKLRKGQ
jgi:branched-chain amino acid transport system substrate-binding protein